jgi:predicted NodU family carbamoyl transferase
MLGLSAFHHDNATALIENRRVIAAAQDERFTRKKFDADFPKRSLARVQTMHRKTSPLCYELIDRFNAVLRRRAGHGAEGELRRPVRAGSRRYPFRLSAVRCGGVR